jgi:hypothetical protein
MKAEEILREQIENQGYNSIYNYLTDSGIQNKNELIIRCMENYARIQIEKDRERIKKHIMNQSVDCIIDHYIDQTLIILD